MASDGLTHKKLKAFATFDRLIGLKVWSKIKKRKRGILAFAGFFTYFTVTLRLFSLSLVGAYFFFTGVAAALFYWTIKMSS